MGQPSSPRACGAECRARREVVNRQGLLGSPGDGGGGEELVWPGDWGGALKGPPICASNHSACPVDNSD